MIACVLGGIAKLCTVLARGKPIESRHSMDIKMTRYVSRLVEYHKKSFQHLKCCLAVLQVLTSSKRHCEISFSCIFWHQVYIHEKHLQNVEILGWPLLSICHLVFSICFNFLEWRSFHSIRTSPSYLLDYIHNFRQHERTQKH